MNTQKSFQTKVDPLGTLYIVPTPIGNLEDITFRAISTLKEVDQIAAEDTRQTKKLLSHFDIHTPLVSYHEHNKGQREELLINELKKGKDIAVVSDAGMPAISDPGFDLSHRAIEEGIYVVVLPGANAGLCALVGSGLSTEQFFFHGFLPRKKKERKEELESLKNVSSTLIFYESPHRLKETLKSLYDVLGNRPISLARELTKRYEEYIRGTMEEVLNWANESEIRGEFCLVIEGNKIEEATINKLWWSALSINAHVEHYITEDNLTSKEAVKQVAKDRQLPKRDVYNEYHS